MIKGRIIEVHRTNYTVFTEQGEFVATVRGVFHEEGDFPKVGDYVSLELLDDEKAVIETVEERSSVIKRKSADGEGEQIIAANVDIVFIVMGLDGDFNVNRLERYLLLVQQSGVKPVVVLNKSDLLKPKSEQIAEVEAAAGEVKVLVVSATNGDGMNEFTELITNETTAVLLGSSGAGKSTITNWLLEEDRQAVKEIREDDSRGRHTTTSRHLFFLPQGGFLIDTPGMRELGVLENDADDEQIVFDKIEEFSNRCKFSNCDHEKSVGCAVLAAIESGGISDRELNNYHKLIREREFHEAKGSHAAAQYRVQNEKRQSQQIAAAQRQRLSRGLR
ncbi:MAG: ribosome small subunit-dependent GTPase A [Candidatus Pacebacteria bacterium]|nr:ribosome small subunit-dependent GTPase A [Candidatus Paceibacterota bacterium]